MYVRIKNYRQIVTNFKCKSDIYFTNFVYVYIKNCNIYIYVKYFFIKIFKFNLFNKHDLQLY